MNSREGTPIEGVETKTRKKSFTLKQLDQLAKRFGKSSDWVRQQLAYVPRDELAGWLYYDLEDHELPQGSIRKADHLRLYDRDAEIFRFKFVLQYHGACWLRMDDSSEKRAGEDINVLVLIEGSCASGWLVPPKYFTVTTNRGRSAKKQADPVQFDLAQWKKRGNWERNVLFEGDTKPPPTDEVKVDSPVGRLCSILGVHVEDLERSVSNLVLTCAEDPWVPLDYSSEQFKIGLAVPSAIRYRLLESGLGADIERESPADAKTA